MFAAKISITSDNNDSIPSLIRILESLLYAWRVNGQIIGREQTVFLNQNEIIATAIIPEEHALEADNNTEAARLLNLDIREMKGTKLEIKVVGISPYALSTCDCKKPGSYILYTNHASLSSPIRCGDCSFPIPIYKAAPSINGDRNYITNWQMSYQSCDMLQVNSTVGEQFSQRQLQTHDSPLAKEGREICKIIEEYTGKPTFYYLSKLTGKSLKQEQKRKCPSCGKNWLLKKPWHDIFDFKCDDCRLLSSVGWSIRTRNESR